MAANTELKMEPKKYGLLLGTANDALLHFKGYMTLSQKKYRWVTMSVGNTS